MNSIVRSVLLVAGLVLHLALAPAAFSQGAPVVTPFGPTWTDTSPAPGSRPAGRGNVLATYDAANDRMIIFSGEPNSNDVWVLKNASGRGGTTEWQQLLPADPKPSLRHDPAGGYDPTTNRLVIWGGTTSGGTGGGVTDLWVLENANGLGGAPAWTELTSQQQNTPTLRQGPHYAYDPAGNRLFVFGGWNGGNFSDVFILGNANGRGGTTPTWTAALATTGGPPPASSSGGAAYDPATDRLMIGFGFTSAGTNAIWALKNATGGTPTWEQLHSGSSGAPPIRGQPTFSYDRAGNRLVIFGGRDAAQYNDTWVLEDANGLRGSTKTTPRWRQLPVKSPGLPLERFSLGGALTADGDRLMIFGGGRFSSSQLNDTWVLDLHPGWTELHPTGSPPLERWGPLTSHDAANDRLILFGGTFHVHNGTVNDVRDTWILTNASGASGTPAWQQLSTTGGPPPGQIAAGGGYDPASNRFVVTGGHPFASGVVSEVWVLTNANGTGGAATWQQLSPGGSPAVTRANASCYDAGTNRLFVFGGIPPANNAVWMLENANARAGSTPAWRKLAQDGATGGPAVRWYASLAYRPASDRLIIAFGGDPLFNDAWVLKNAVANADPALPQWEKLLDDGAAGSPTKRASAVGSRAYDPAGDRLYLFGGYTSGTPPDASDLWVLDDADGRNSGGSAATPAWTQLSPTGGLPPSRMYGALTLDATRGRLILYGGRPGFDPPANGDLTSRGDVWVFRPPIVAEGQPVSVTVAASDPDGDAIASLAADLSGLPGGHNAVFTPRSSNTAGTLTWTPTSSDGRAAPYIVTFTATANALSGSARVAILVQDQVRTWVGGGDTSWGNDANWSPPGAPSSDDDIRVQAGSGPSVVSATVTVRSLTLPAGFTSVITVNAPLTIGQDLVITSGTLAIGTGSLAVAGSVTVNGGTLKGSISGPGGPVTLTAGGALKGSAAVGRAVVVGPGGRLSPGD